MITDIFEGIIANQAYIFNGRIDNFEFGFLESYSFRLYNQSDMVIEHGKTMYDSALKHKFNNLQNNTIYKVDFQIRTITGLEATSPK